jgi:glutamine amidotransferase
MRSIAVIDYGMGNLRSVVNALQVVTEGRDQVLLTSDPAQVLAADRVVFPGQGAAGDCMRAIDDYGLREAIVTAARQQPFLGICIPARSGILVIAIETRAALNLRFRIWAGTA